MQHLGETIFKIILNVIKMAKRFTDNLIWKKGWFMKLPPHIKLLWQYLRDDCDAAGIWEPNFDVASLFVGEQVTERDLEYFGDRVEKIENGKYWLTGFIEFQYNNNLSEKSPAHKPIFSSINKNKIHNRVFNRLSNSLSDTLQDKDKEIEKDKAKEKDLQEFLQKEEIAPRMLKLFKIKNSNYPVDKVKDATACLEISYKIAEASGIERHIAITERKDDVLAYWQQIIDFVLSDKWFSTRSISDLNKEWQRLIQSINNGTKPIINGKGNQPISGERLNQAHAKYFGAK